eukprot:207275_1
MSLLPIVFILLMILTVHTTEINDDKSFQSHDICLLKQFDTHEKGADYNNEHNIMNINQYTVVISIFVVAIFILYFLYPTQSINQTQSIHQPPAINQPPAIHQP